MSKTKIEWAEETVNPFVGCQKISPGCDNCYALRMAWRLSQNPNPKIANKYKGTVEKVNGQVRWTGQVNLDPSCWDSLYNCRKGKRVFVGSMGDIGFENIPVETFNAILDRCYSINNHRIHYSKKEPHQFLFLTKRPKRFAALWEFYFKSNDTRENRDDWQSWPLYDDVYSTFWVGVTVEEQANARIPLLLSIPAAKRFVSIEPMLGEVNLGLMGTAPKKWGHERHVAIHELLDLVICGGESGPGARPVHPDWVRSLRDQCKEAGVPFFFKQWGEWYPINRNWGKNVGCWSNGKFYLYSHPPNYTGIYMQRVGKKTAGRELDGKEYLEWPE